MPATRSQTPSEAEVNEFRRKLDALIGALEAHPLMTSTPATTAPKALYFTWDFVQRTKHNLSQINTQALFSNDPVAREAYSDCVGRSVLTDIIIHDQSGKANLMFPQSEPLDWGEEIRAKAKELSSGGD